MFLLCGECVIHPLREHNHYQTNKQTGRAVRFKGLHFDLDFKADEAMRQNDHIYSVGCAGRKWRILIKCNETVFIAAGGERTNHPMEFQYSDVFSSRLLLPSIRLEREERVCVCVNIAGAAPLVKHRPHDMSINTGEVF